MATRTVRPGQAAEALRIGTAALQSLARGGRIPFDLTPGGHRRFDIEEVRAALTGGSEVAPRRPPLRQLRSIRVEIRRDYYYDEDGPRTIATVRHYPAVPRQREHVALAEGWPSAEVRTVLWDADGSVIVILEPEPENRDKGLLDLGWRELEHADVR